MARAVMTLTCWRCSRIANVGISSPVISPLATIDAARMAEETSNGDEVVVGEVVAGDVVVSEVEADETVSGEAVSSAAAAG